MRAFSKTSKLAIIGGSLAVALGTGALATRVPPSWPRSWA